MLIDDIVGALKVFKKYEGMTLQRVTETSELLHLASGLEPREIIDLVDRASRKIEVTKYRVAVRSALRFEHVEIDGALARIRAAAKVLDKEVETVRKYVNDGIQHLAVFVAEELQSSRRNPQPLIEEVIAGPFETEVSVAGSGKITAMSVDSSHPGTPGHLYFHIEEVDTSAIIWSLDCSFEEGTGQLYSVTLNHERSSGGGGGSKILTYVNDAGARMIEILMQFPDEPGCVEICNHHGDWVTSEALGFMPTAHIMRSDLYSLWFSPGPDCQSVRISNCGKIDS